MPRDLSQSPAGTAAGIDRIEERQSSADTRMDRHEIICADRYKALDSQITRLHGRIDTLIMAMFGMAVTTVLTLVTVIGQALIHK